MRELSLSSKVRLTRKVSRLLLQNSDRLLYGHYQPDASLLKEAANDFRVASGSILGRIPEMKRHAPAAPCTRAPKPTTRVSGYPVQRQRRQASKETRAIRVSQAKFAQVALPLARVT